MRGANAAGMARADQLGAATLRDGQIFMIDKTTGFHAPAPDMQQNVYQTIQHNLAHAYDQPAQSRSQPQPAQTFNPSR